MSTNLTSEDDAFMEAQRRAGKRLVVRTRSRGGCLALDADGRWYEQPIVNEYPRVDANGAGDAFFSSYLWERPDPRWVDGRTTRPTLG